MKKTAVLIFILLIAATCFVCADTPAPLEEGSISYVNVPVIKVLEHRDFYVVYYQQFGTKIGCVSIPREWFKQGQAERKGWVKPLAKNCSPYISIFFVDGEFSRINLNLPNSKLDSVWGVFSGSNIPAQIDPFAFVSGR